VGCVPVAKEGFALGRNPRQHRSLKGTRTLLVVRRGNGLPTGKMLPFKPGLGLVLRIGSRPDRAGTAWRDAYEGISARSTWCAPVALLLEADRGAAVAASSVSRSRRTEHFRPHVARGNA